MVTNCPQQLTAAAGLGREASVAFLARVATRLGQVLCGLRGHDTVRHFEGKRVMMRCTSCGFDTPGWEIGDRAPRRRLDGDPRHHRLNAPRLVVRKSA